MGKSSRALHFTTDHTVRREGVTKYSTAPCSQSPRIGDQQSITSLAETVRSSLFGGWGRRGSGRAGLHQRACRNAGVEEVTSLDRCRRLPNHRREPSLSSRPPNKCGSLLDWRIWRRKRAKRRSGTSIHGRIVRSLSEVRQMISIWSSGCISHSEPQVRESCRFDSVNGMAYPRPGRKRR